MQLLKDIREESSTAQLVKCLPKVPEVGILRPTNVSLQRCLLKLPTNEKEQIIQMFHMGLILPITLI
jgi:hypothetical protein